MRGRQCSFALDELDRDSGRPYLAQVHARSVDYNELVRFSESTLADLQSNSLCTADDDRDDVAVPLTRVAMERRGDVLRAQTL